jgi:hypothetical protein
MGSAVGVGCGCWRRKSSVLRRGRAQAFASKSPAHLRPLIRSPAAPYQSWWPRPTPQLHPSAIATVIQQLLCLRLYVAPPEAAQTSELWCVSRSMGSFLYPVLLAIQSASTASYRPIRN